MINVDPPNSKNSASLPTAGGIRTASSSRCTTSIRCDLTISIASQIYGKIILDVGCGGGLLSEAMAARGAKVTGIDMGDKP
jgi:2-polyprenyl-3-methyl-5-hydroxy-6-metoxy-1,4-benzoquinol methylase